jgi:hypothetical protein
MKKISLSEVKDDKTEDDRFEYRLERDSQFLASIDKARSEIGVGRGFRLEDLAK